MRKKESWMFKGAFVLAGGKRATISKMQENTFDGNTYVYYIWVRLEGDKKVTGPYHPNDIEQLIAETTIK